MNKVGRPLKFKSPEELQEKIDKYFLACDNRTEKKVTKEGKIISVPAPLPYTITGLALALDCDRDTLLNYEEKEEYFGAIRTAKLKCQNYAEQSLWLPKIATGVIFNLVNNYGWKNKTETDHTSKGERINGFNFIKPDEADNNPNK